MGTDNRKRRRIQDGIEVGATLAVALLSEPRCPRFFDQKEFTDTFEMLCWDAEDSDSVSDVVKQKCQSKGGYRPWPEFQ